MRMQTVFIITKILFFYAVSSNVHSEGLCYLEDKILAKKILREESYSGKVGSINSLKNYVSIHYDELSIRNPDKNKVVIMPLSGAVIKKIGDKEVELLEVAIFHQQESIDFAYDLGKSGCVLVIKQESFVSVEGSKEFHYSHFKNSVNKYASIEALVVRKEKTL